MFIDDQTYKRGDKTYRRVLLRNSFRVDGRVRHETVANLSKCDDEEIEALKLALRHKGDLKALAVVSEDVSTKQGQSVGARFLLWELAGKLGISQALGRCREAKLVLWLVFAAVMEQGSRLSAVRLAQRHALPADFHTISAISKPQIEKLLTETDLVDVRQVGTQEVHDRYMELTEVEWAFRTMKTVMLEMRGIFVRKEERTRAHVFITMLAYLIAFELRRLWRDQELTVEEGLSSLAQCCATEVKVGSASAHTIPEPRDSAMALLEAAGVSLPDAIPCRNVSVVTRKKLVPERLSS